MRGGRLALGLGTVAAALVAVALWSVSRDDTSAASDRVGAAVTPSPPSAGATTNSPAITEAPVERVRVRTSEVRRPDADAAPTTAAAAGLVDELIADDSFKEEREKVLARLLRLPASQSVPALLAELESEQKSRFEPYLVRALLEVGEGAAPWARRIAALDVGDDRRADLLSVLGLAGWPVVVRLSTDPDPASRHVAALALSAQIDAHVDGATEMLVALAGDADPTVARAAVEALGRVPDPSSAVLSALVTALGAADPEVQSAAREGLIAYGPVAAGVADDIVALVRDRRGSIRGWGRSDAAVIVAVTGNGEAAAAALQAAKPADAPFWRERGWRGLRGVGANPDLLAVLAQSADARHRIAAAQAAADTLERSDAWSDLGDVMVTCLTDAEAPVRVAALGSEWGAWRGTPPPAAVTALLALTQDTDPVVRGRALYQAVRIGGLAPESLLPALRAALASADPGDRGMALDAVTVRGESLRALGPALIERVWRATGAERARALFALRALAPSDDSALSAAVDALGDPDPDVRVAAIGAVVVLDPPGEAARPVLEALFDGDAGRYVQRNALSQLVVVRDGTWVPFVLDCVAANPDFALVASGAVVGRDGLAAAVRRRIEEGASPAARRAFVLFLRGPDPASRALLEDLAANDEDEAVRRAASERLGPRQR